MPLVNLPIPPGVVANGESYQVGTAGRWHRANLVRWVNGLLMPVGGWLRLTADPMDGIARASHPWRNLRNQRFLATGTDQGLYVWDDDTGYEITPTYFTTGRESAVYGDGYGVGPYGDADYGTAREAETDRILLDATTWSLDNWGEDLIACASHEGTIYTWSPGDVEAEALENAPDECVGIIVTEERILVALGADGDSRAIAWSDREDNTDWTPTATNAAGDIQLVTNGRIRTAIRVRGEILILTDTDAHSMRFVGQPLVYGFERVGTNCGVYGAKAVASFDGGAVWFGPGGFFGYTGQVQPLLCSVQDYVYSDINLLQKSKFFAGANPDFQEIWFWYCSANSEEIDRYVIFNYAELHWSIGELDRTSWATNGIFNKPIMAAPDGHLYEHESGWTDNGEAIGARRYAESGAASISPGGDQVMTVLKMLPDERTLGDTRVRFKTRFAPNDTETVYGPFALAAFTDMRFQARQVALRIEGVADSDWRVGLPRFDVQPGGRR
jgi:hypothetical protein